MNAWTQDDLRHFTAAEDLYISPFREDGTTPGTPTRVWSVVVDGDVYVRPASGRKSSWYVAATTQRAGQIRIGGVEHEVRFEPAEDSVNDAVDAAYEATYADASSVAVMVGPDPRSATVRIVRQLP